jgi:hypothetical protein
MLTFFTANAAGDRRGAIFGEFAKKVFSSAPYPWLSDSTVLKEQLRILELSISC